MLQKLAAKGYEILFTSHADAILGVHFPNEVQELEAALDAFTIDIVELIEGGGGEAPFTQRLRRELFSVGWAPHNFKMKKLIDGVERESITHKMDHIRTTAAGTLALELEWNNKSEFYDRDLENFKRLHGEGVFSVAILITRGKSFQDNIANMIDAFAQQHQVRSFADLEKFDGYDPSRKFIQKVNDRVAATNKPFREVWVKEFVTYKYATTTTHWDRLKMRVDRGVGNPCPMLLIGIPDAIVTS